MVPAKSNLRSAPGSSGGSKRGSGLGRGLAGILGDNRSATEAEPKATRGLLQLVGGQSGPRMAEIGRFVVETALGSVADGFGAEGLLLVGRGPVGAALDREAGPSDAADPSPTAPLSTAPLSTAPLSTAPLSIAPRLPANWTVDSPELFELHGLLWGELDPLESGPSDEPGPSEVADTADGPEFRQRTLGGRSVVIGRLVGGSEALATAIVRDRHFDDAELTVLATVLNSVIGTVARTEEPAARPADLAVSVRGGGAAEGEEVKAEVTLGPEHGRLTATGRAADGVMAVAMAAANACRPQCEVVFAGSSPVDDAVVSVVMVGTSDGLRFGFAVAEDGDLGGPAAAVLSAAGLTGRDAAVR